MRLVMKTSTFICRNKFWSDYSVNTKGNSFNYVAECSDSPLSADIVYKDLLPGL